MTLDGNVDPADLNALALNWQGEVASWGQGDLTGDGRVDAADLNKIGTNWLQTAPNPAPVPEPSAIVLFSVPLLLLSASLLRETDDRT